MPSKLRRALGHITLLIADRAYFMRAGEIILEQDSATALARRSWWDLF